MAGVARRSTRGAAQLATVGGRLLFCGEHTHRQRYAHADGAMTTGIREAKRLLRVSAVTLSGA